MHVCRCNAEKIHLKACAMSSTLDHTTIVFITVFQLLINTQT